MLSLHLNTEAIENFCLLSLIAVMITKCNSVNLIVLFDCII